MQVSTHEKKGRGVHLEPPFHYIDLKILIAQTVSKQSA